MNNCLEIIQFAYSLRVIAFRYKIIICWNNYLIIKIIHFTAQRTAKRLFWKICSIT